MRQVENNEKEICLYPIYNSAKETFAVAHCGCEKFTRIISWKKKKNPSRAINYRNIVCISGSP